MCVSAAARPCTPAVVIFSPLQARPTARGKPHRGALLLAKAVVFGQRTQQLVAALGALAVLGLHLADELLHLGMTVGVLQVLGVGLPTLQRVVLDTDQVVDIVVSRGVRTTHVITFCVLVGRLPVSWRSGVLRS